MEASVSERQQLDQLHRNLGRQLDELGAENQRLQATNGDLVRHRDHLHDDKTELLKEQERLNKDRERRSV